MIERFNQKGELDVTGEFVKLDDMQELLEFLYTVMASKADVAIDILAEKGEEYLQKWHVL